MIKNSSYNNINIDDDNNGDQTGWRMETNHIVFVPNHFAVWETDICKQHVWFVLNASSSCSEQSRESRNNKVYFIYY